MGFRQDDTAPGNHVTPATAVLASPVLAGSLITILVEQRNGPSSIGVPSGFTLDALSSASVGGSWHVGLYSKIATGAEGTNFAVTSNVAAGHCITVTEYTGYGALVGGSVQTLGPSVGTNYTFSVSPAGNALAVVGAVARDDSDTVFTPVASFTERQDTNLGTVSGGGGSGPQMAYGDRELTPGTYTVGFNASGGGLERGAVVALYTGAPPPTPPVADFSGTPTIGTGPLEVDFTDLSTNTPTSWLWDFGDGDTSTAENPTHVYNLAGYYTVELTVTNADGSDSETKTSYIRVISLGLDEEVHEILPPGDDIQFVGNLYDSYDRVIRPVLNEPGTGQFSINRHSPNATASIIKPGNLVRVTVPDIDPDAIFAWFMETGNFTLVSDDEDGGEEIVVGGRGVLSYWDRAVWLSEKFTVPWWPDDVDDPPAGAKGLIRVKAGTYRFYNVSGGIIDGGDPYDLLTVSAFDAYFTGRQTYQWPAENSKRFLVNIMTGEPHDSYWFHPHQDGVTEILASQQVGTSSSVLLSDISPDTPGVILHHLYTEGQSPDRPVQPIPLMTIDFTDTLDSNGDPWATTDALAGITAELGETYLDTITKLVGTGVIDVWMGPDLDMHAYNAPSGRDLTGAFGAGNVRFERGVNIASQLTREREDNPVATFIEVVGTDNVVGRAVLPDAASRVAREISDTGDSADENVLEALGLAKLNVRLVASDAIVFQTSTGNDEDDGRYFPGPEGTDNGKYWLGDTVTLHTGDGEQDFDEVDQRVFAVTIAADDAANLDVMPEVGSVLGEAERRLFALERKAAAFSSRSETTDTEVSESAHPDINAHDALGLVTDVEFDLHRDEVLDHSTAEMDDTLVLKPDGVGGLEFGPGGGGSITVDETDGSPSVADVTTIRFPSGTVTDLTGGVVSVQDVPTGFIGAKNTTGSITLSNGAYVYPAFAGADDWDTDGIHNPASNNTRFTVPAGMGGKWMATILGSWPAVAQADRRVGYRVNGGTTSIIVRHYYNNPGVSLIHTGSVVLDLAPGDYVEAALYTDAAAGTGAAHMTFVKLDSGKVGQGIGCTAIATGTTNMTNGTFTPIAFGDEEFDTDAFHDNSTNNTRITIPAGLGGTYVVLGQCEWDTNTTGERVLTIEKNGAGSQYGWDRKNIPNAAGQSSNVQAIIPLVAGDYVELKGYHNAGSTRTVTGTNRTRLSVARIDSGSGAPDGVRNQIGNGQIIIPGFAAHPDIPPGGASDDEFDTTDTSDPMTGWTTVGTPTAHNINSTVKSHYYVAQSPVAATNLVGIQKAWTPVNGDIWTCKLTGMTGAEASAFAGLALISTGGVYHGGGWLFNGTRLATMAVSSWASRTGARTNLLNAGSEIVPDAIYIRVVFGSSTNLTWYFSRNGKLWHIFHGYNPGVTFNAVALICQAGTTNFSGEAIFDWIRKS